MVTRRGERETGVCQTKRETDGWQIRRRERETDGEQIRRRERETEG